MIDTELAFIIAGAGYGLTIGVFITLSVIIRMITAAVQKWDSFRGERS